MIEEIKKTIESRKGKKLKFKYNKARNQTEEFDGEIINAYHFIFTIKTCDEVEIIKSFTYSDILTETLEIFD
jgi:uncharacterized protein Veg